jgi:hypothetical protein
LGDIYTTPPIADTDVNVSLQVNDLSDFTVTLTYRINDGAWNDIIMVDTGDGYNATIPGQPIGTEVDYYIEAVDAFWQASRTVQIGYTIADDTQPPPPPNMLPVLVAVGVIIAVVAVIVIYMFVLKPKQSSG